MGHFDHWSMYHDNLSLYSTPNDTVPSSPSHGGQNSPPRQGYINGFGSLRLREVRSKGKWKEPKGTWNARMLHSQDSLDSGIVISNGQAGLDPHQGCTRPAPSSPREIGN